MLDLSIIIPVYNTAPKALTRCLDSLSSLEGICWEAILVDDGSREPIGQYCRDYAAAHPNFHCFHKENGGASSARNYGLEQAAGQYVMFVDADDVLLGAPIRLELFRDDTDLTVLDMQLMENSTDRTWHSLPDAAGTVTRQRFLERLLCSKDLNSPCIKLFRRALIQEQNLRFRTDHVAGEDWFFVTEFALLAQSFRYVKEPCYRYFRDSATSRSRQERYADILPDNYAAIYAKKQSILAQEAFPPALRQALDNAAATCLVEDLCNLAADLLLQKAFTPQRKTAIRQALLPAEKNLAAMPLKSRLKGQILLHFPAALWPMAVLRAGYLAIK